jgi:hypothetical protein
MSRRKEKKSPNVGGFLHSGEEHRMEALSDVPMQLQVLLAPD